MAFLSQYFLKSILGTALSPLQLPVTRVWDSWTGGDTRLLGLSVGGQLRRIAVRGEAEGAGPSRGPTGPTVQMGRSVRDQLSAIGDVCERYGNTVPL